MAIPKPSPMMRSAGGDSFAPTVDGLMGLVATIRIESRNGAGGRVEDVIAYAHRVLTADQMAEFERRLAADDTPAGA